MRTSSLDGVYTVRKLTKTQNEVFYMRATRPSKYGHHGYRIPQNDTVTPRVALELRWGDI